LRCTLELDKCNASPRRFDRINEFRDQRRFDTHLRVKSEDKRTAETNCLLECGTPEGGAHVLESFCTELEERQCSIHCKVVVKQWQTCKPAQPRANRVLAGCRRAVNEDDLHAWLMSCL